VRCKDFLNLRSPDAKTAINSLASISVKDLQLGSMLRGIGLSCIGVAKAAKYLRPTRTGPALAFGSIYCYGVI
jgi:hypothetical protein